jgi:hypothetical protein
MGDIPSAYMLMNDLRSPHAALKRYIEGLEEWISAVRSRAPTDGLIPIEIRQDHERVAMTESRVNYIENSYPPNNKNERPSLMHGERGPERAGLVRGSMPKPE